jgi:hypothetical protein
MQLVQKWCYDFSLQFAHLPYFFHLVMLGMFLAHVMHVLNMLGV